MYNDRQVELIKRIKKLAKKRFEELKNYKGIGYISVLMVEIDKALKEINEIETKTLTMYDMDIDDFVIFSKIDENNYTIHITEDPNSVKLRNSQVGELEHILKIYEYHRWLVVTPKKIINKIKNLKKSLH